MDMTKLTHEDLQKIIMDACKGLATDEIDKLRKEVNDVLKKNAFPFLEKTWGDGEAGSMNDSVIDTSTFYKSYNTSKNGNALQDGKLLGKQLVSIGGPFKRLSPEMMTFAKMIQTGKGSVTRSKEAGIDVEKHNNTVKEVLKAAGMSEGTVADGGALVPVEFLASVIEFAVAQSQIISKVWRVPMSTQTLKIPKLVQSAGNYFGGVVLYSPGEGELKIDTKPSFDRLTFEAKKLIGLVYLTDELIADSMINVINYLFGLFARAFQYDMERRIISGTGGAAAGPCLGIIKDPLVIANAVARTTAGTIKYEDIIALDSKIDEQFANLVWLTRKKTQNTLMGLKDSQNRPLFLANYESFAGMPIHPPELISYPVYKTRNVPDLGAQGDIILGDLSYYMLTIRQDMKIDSSEGPRFEYDETTLRFVMRFDGMPVVPIAFTFLKSSNS